MPTEAAVDASLIDHHCHGVVPGDLDLGDFEALMSESYRTAPPGTTQFDKPLGLAMRRWCAPMLDLEPFASGEAYVERRQALGAEEVNRRLLGACGLERLLVDSGHRSESIATPATMAELAGRPADEVVRIEAVAEEVACTGVSAAAFPQALADELDRRSRTAVGLKTIVAYRTTFAIDQTPPNSVELAHGVDRWFAESERAGKVRLAEVDVVRSCLWVGAELCRDRSLPLQVHVGFGDPDIYMHACDPTHFTDFLRAMEAWEVPCMLLHNYPFQREAAWLAEVFQNVYYDVGVILNFAGPTAADILGEALEMGPFFKQLYSSDAFGLAELYYLGQLQFRRALKHHLDRWIADGQCNGAEADRIVAMLASSNARRVYHL
ncbi:MAG: amidohydrolase family protein [Kiloniellales bacterium]